MKYLSLIKKYLPVIRRHAEKYAKLAQKSLSKFISYAKTKLASWWQIIAVSAFAIIFLYYPIGGWLINDTSTPSYQPQDNSQSLATIDSINFLINQEVHHKIWTPNLPVLFPSYFLDNMPNFQLGVLSAVSDTTSALSRFSFTTLSSSAEEQLSKSAELLQYPGTIWLFSPQNSLLPATSSSTQYKKGRRLLKLFNQSISEGKTIIHFDHINFVILLKSIKKDLAEMVRNTADHIRENQTSFFDFKADNIFYYDYGKLYAYSQIAKGIGHDFKETLIKYDIYSTWTSFLKTLEDVTLLEPMIVRNGQLDSSFAPNHLIVINYQASHAINYLNAIIDKLP